MRLDINLKFNVTLNKFDSVIQCMQGRLQNGDFAPALRKGARSALHL